MIAVSPNTLEAAFKRRIDNSSQEKDDSSSVLKKVMLLDSDIELSEDEYNDEEHRTTESKKSVPQKK